MYSRANHEVLQIKGILTYLSVCSFSTFQLLEIYDNNKITIKLLAWQSKMRQICIRKVHEYKIALTTMLLLLLRFHSHARVLFSENTLQIANNISPLTRSQNSLWTFFKCFSINCIESVQQTFHIFFCWARDKIIVLAISMLFVRWFFFHSCPSFSNKREKGMF